MQARQDRHYTAILTNSPNVTGVHTCYWQAGAIFPATAAHKGEVPPKRLRMDT